MKKIEAIIRPESLEDVKRALLAVDISGMHAENVVGHGHQGGIKRAGRGGQPYTVDMLPKVKLVVVVSTDEWMQKAVDAIIQSARSGNIGDGKIFITEVHDAIRVRTGESGPEVL